MPHFLGYHKLRTGEGFFRSDFYGKNQIDAIPDPEGGNTDKPPTSIPSPFAAMDLTRTAFRRIVENQELKGDKIDQKLVSQCWDVGEMFFNSSTFGEDLKIMPWDPQKDLLELTNSSEGEGHRILGDTLKMFMDQDADAYNFGSLKKLYLLKYKYNLLGGTSPCTLFFSTLNPVENNPEVHVKLVGDDTWFDADYKALHEREDSFQIFIYSLQKLIPGFSVKLREVNDYLVKNLEILKTRNNPLFKKINELKKENYSADFDELNLGHAGSALTIMGLPLRRKKNKTDGQSDFKILSTKYSGQAPLVLTPDFGGSDQLGQTMTYFDSPFNDDIRNAIPYYHTEADITNRVLPGLTGQKYPYLLVSDLLEDSIVKLIYPINSDKFFDGNLSSSERAYGFLLPLKPKFFEFFNTDYLTEVRMPDGKPSFEMEERGTGGVKVILRLKINNGYIEFDRIYMPPVSAQGSSADLSRNQGGMKEALLGVNIFPFVRASVKGLKNEYRIQSVSKEYNFETIINELSFYSNLSTSEVSVKSVQERSDIKNHNYGTKVYLIDSEFDFIRLKHGELTGVIIPKWTNHIGGSDIYHFSVDFGTTNTHIEYTVNGKKTPKPFNIDAKDIQVGVLHDSAFIAANPQEERFILDQSLVTEFKPLHIGSNLHHRFPQRTVLIEPNNLNLNTPTYALADFNIPFIYERQSIDTQNKISTDLKWSNYVQGEDDKKRVRAYLENLMLLMKAKVLLNEGNIEKTQLTWFYPSSMLPNRRNQLEKMWVELAREHLHKDINPTQISESIAPFYYYRKNLNVGAMTRPAVSIDIGGGTTDFVVFEKDKPTYLSSFRFAANSIFGDAYGSSPQRNGFVNKYKLVIENLLNTNVTYLSKLASVFPEIMDSDNSADIIAFFMSLENNISVKENNLPISFQEKLRDDQDMKLVILLFYSAIIYHLARFMSFNKIPMPKNIIFSGNGSKVIGLIDESLKFSSLKELSSLIFYKVYSASATSEEEKAAVIKPNLNIEQFDAPKEITCKGGLLFDQRDSVNIESIKKVLIGSIDEPQSKIQYPDVDSELLHSVADEVESFIKLFFELHSEFNFFHNFSINAALLDESERALLDRDELLEQLERGIQNKKEQLFGNEKIAIEETLFFYPLVGMMNKLAYDLSLKS